MSQKEQTVLPARMGGGPHNLGDPDDMTLRKVEKDVLIPKRIREKARVEKCIPEVEEFTKCCKATWFSMVYKCRKENSELIACLTKWYNDEKFREECTQEYLEERRQYRLTGLSKKARMYKLQ